MSTDNFCFGCEELFDVRYEDCFTCSQFQECKEAIDAPFLNMEVQVINTPEMTQEERALVDIMAIIEAVETKTVPEAVEIVDVISEKNALVAISESAQPEETIPNVINKNDIMKDKAVFDEVKQTIENEQPKTLLDCWKIIKRCLPMTNKQDLYYRNWAKKILLSSTFVMWGGETKEAIIWQA